MNERSLGIDPRNVNFFVGILQKKKIIIIVINNILSSICIKTKNTLEFAKANNDKDK